MPGDGAERLLPLSVLDSLLDPVAVLEPVRDAEGAVVDFTYAEANASACRQNRLTREELLGRRLLEIYPGHASSGLLDRYASVVETGEALVLNDQEYANELFPGGPRVYDIRATKVGESLSVTWRDVTERHRAAADLKHSRERFQALAELSSDVVFFVDPEGSVQWVSPAVEQVLGYRPEQLVGTKMADLVHPDERAAEGSRCDLGDLARAVRANGYHVQDVRVRTHNGRYRWVRIDSRVLRDEQGKPVGAVCGWRDVDDLVRARLDQESAAVRSRVTMDALMDPVLVLEPVGDASGRVVDFVLADVNDAACAFDGRSREELQGSRLTEIDAALAQAVGIDVLADVAKGGPAHSADDVPFDDENRPGIRFVDVRAGSALGGLILTVRDATARHEAAETIVSNERRFRMLAESVTDIVLELDHDDVVVWASPSIERSLGISPVALLGRPISEVLPSVTGNAEGPKGHRAGETIRLVQGTGTMAAWMAVRVVPVVDPAGEVRGSVVGMTDVSATVKARSQVDRARAETRRTQLSMEEAAIGMLRLDSEGVVSYANAKAADLLGEPASELIGRDLRGLGADSDEGLIRAFARVRGSISQREQLRFSFHDHGTRTVWVDAFLSPVREEDGTVSEVLVQMVDVSQEVASHQALTVSREHFRLLAENSSDVVFETDTAGIIRWVSPSIDEAMGWATEDLLGHLALDYVHPDDVAEVIATAARTFGGGETSGVVVRLRGVMGDYRWFSARSASIRGSAREITGAVVGLRDVTKEVEAQRRLESSERTFRTAMAEAPQGMALADLRDVMTEVNPSLARIIGLPEADLVGHRLAEFCLTGRSDGVTCAEALLRSGDSQVTGHEHEIRAEAPRRAWIQHSLSLIREADGTPLYFVHQVVDVSDTKQREEDLQFQASHDLLTGLLNRAGLLSRVVDWLPEDGNAAGLAVLYGDLDGLKGINDAHGHAGGDAVLVEVARRLATNLRRGDVAARISGDEFVVLLDRIRTLEDAERLADKIRLAVRGPVEFEGQQLPAAISVGITVAQAGDTAQTLLDRADAALYRAKHGGRDRVSR